MAGQYAKGTKVTLRQSRAEIERTLERFGVSAFFMGFAAQHGAMVAFEHEGRQVRFLLTLPDWEADEFRLTPSRQLRRTPSEHRRLWEQACNERWRALAAGIKAKLAMVEAGITTFDEEFMAHMVLPNGRTVAEEALPAVAEIYATGRVRALLPGSDR